jgi:DNA-repair protein complementing XP-A cells
VLKYYTIAKARQKEARARAEAQPSSTPNQNNKRPLEVTLATSTSPTAPSKRAYDTKDGKKNEDMLPLKKNSRLSNYFEYDLSKMVNTKGGFLVEEDGVGKEVDEELRRREKLREKERIEKNAEPCECSKASNILIGIDV